MEIPILQKKDNFFFYKKYKTEDVDSKEKAMLFIDKNSLSIYLKILSEIKSNLDKFYCKLIILLSPFYFIVSLSAYTSNYEENNYKIYIFLRYIHVPSVSPQAWNLSYFLSIIFSATYFACVLIKIRKNRSYLISFKIIKYPAKYLALWPSRIVYIIFFVIYIFFGYMIVDGKTLSNQCTIWDLCFLRTDDMFLFSTLLCYFCFNMAGYSLYRVFYIRSYEEGNDLMVFVKKP